MQQQPRNAAGPSSVSTQQKTKTVVDANLDPNNLWAIAAKTKPKEVLDQEPLKTFVFCGDKSVGKTNLILKFLDIQ